jgi:PAS domain S-box-containing protein
MRLGANFNELNDLQRGLTSFNGDMAEDSTLVEGFNPRSDEAFHELLLRFSTTAAQGTSAGDLIRYFCRELRHFFRVDGVYFWRRNSADELVGAEADGVMADVFPGTVLLPGQPAVANDAVKQRRTLYVNRLDTQYYKMAGEFHATAILSAPLIVANEVTGAVVLLHASNPDYFSNDLAVKATIMAGQLGSLLEATRLTQVSREEHRRAEILAEVAQTLHTAPNRDLVMEAVADRLRILLRTPLVCIVLRERGSFELRAVAAESADRIEMVRARHDRRMLTFASDLASRAVAAGMPVAIYVDPSAHSLESIAPPGMLVAAPLRTAKAEGAVLVYPRFEGVFSVEEKSLISTLAGFAAVAVANAELYDQARAQAHELHQLLNILLELNSIGEFDEFLLRFAQQAADFLGFSRTFIGLLEEGSFRVQWGAENGEVRRVDHVLPEGPASQKLLNGEAFWSDDAGAVPGANLHLLQEFAIRQVLAVPLLGTGGEVLGMFGVLDRPDGTRISEEDVRRAKALAAQVAVALEVNRNLHRSELHRERAEALMALALDLSTQMRIPELAGKFTRQVSALTGAAFAGLAIKQDNAMELIAMEGIQGRLPSSHGALRRLAELWERSVVDSADEITVASLPEAQAAAGVGTAEAILLRLNGSSGELIGVLGLAGKGKQLLSEDRQLLQAIARHASIALDNAGLFARMDKANRHWIEIFDSISDYIVVHDQDNNVLRVNRSLADLVGVSPQELIGIKMSALLAIGEGIPPRSCPFCACTSAGVGEYVHPVLERTYLISTSPVHEAAGEGMQTIHVIKDITDRREAERRYRELFDNIQEGLFFSTPEGRFVEVNDALVRMLGYDSREELLQTDIPSQIYFSPEHRQALAEEIQRTGVIRNHENLLRRKDGSPVYALTNAVAVRDASGRTVQYRGLMLDISGLKNFQSELQRERDFSGKILNNTQSLILVADTSGNVTYANRRWSEMGYEQPQLLGRPLETLVSPGRRATLNEAVAATVHGRQVDNLELQVIRGDGRLGQFSVNLSPMWDDAGNVTSLVVVMTDITDSATLQSKLMHAEKMAAVGQLVSGVAHEVNNPLTAILGFADLLMENSELPESARKDLRVILQEAQRTKQIVQNLLSFARQMPPQRKAVQLNPILHNTMQLRAYDFQSHGVEVIEKLDQNLPSVIGDSHQLQQVFLNILNNAYDAVRESPRAGRIEIITSRRGSLVEVGFRDNGPGITYPEKIFDPFFTTKEVGKGTGLGLSICYGIVREHGGEILCHNNTDGEGAMFIVRLPATAEILPINMSAGVVNR